MSGEGRPELYRKLGEAYQTPPWNVGRELSLPQFWALYEYDPPAPATHQDAVSAANKRRAEKGLPPLADKLPGRVKKPKGG